MAGILSDAARLWKNSFETKPSAAVLLGDVIRLCTLTPPTVHGWNNKRNPRPSPCDGKPSQHGKYDSICVGRYLLHVYEGDPAVLVGKRGRGWLKSLRSPGSGSIDVQVGDDKAATFREAISVELAELRLKADFTNRVLQQSPKKDGVQYLCVLTRIDAFSVTLGELSWKENENREGTESGSGDWKKLQALVGKHVLFKAKQRSASEEQAENTPPSDNETAQDEEDSLTAETDLVADVDLNAEVDLTAVQDMAAEVQLTPETELKPASVDNTGQ